MNAEPSGVPGLSLRPAEEATVLGAARALVERRVSVRQLVERCLEQIAAWDHCVRAWVLVDAQEARRQADRLDRELARGLWRGPLHGIPVGVKDIFDVRGWPTAAGSRLWAQETADADAPVVAALRQAGAVLVGKTVTTAYASFDPPVTVNPWNFRRTPGGSSSGSAPAVACGMCLLALGSQTGGSIVRPASYCGVAGFKPTYGTWPVAGVVPLAPSLDHVGLLARTACDLRLAWSAVQRALQGLAYAEDPTSLGGSPRVRLGHLTGYLDDQVAPDMAAALADACRCWSDAGAALVQVRAPAEAHQVPRQHRLIMAVEAAAWHRHRLAAHPDDYPPRVRGLLEEGLAAPAVDYVAARAFQTHWRRQVAFCFSEADYLVLPAVHGAAPDTSTTGSPEFQAPWSLSGHPAVTIPAALSEHGLPLGVQLVGPWHSDSALLDAAIWCEEALSRTTP